MPAQLEQSDTFIHASTLAAAQSGIKDVVGLLRDVGHGERSEAG